MADEKAISLSGAGIIKNYIDETIAGSAGEDTAARADIEDLKTALENKADADHTHTTVNGHTVESDVPSDAKFTDTVYTHPTTAGNKHVPSGGSSGQILGWSSSGTAEWIDNEGSSYTLPTASSTTLGGVKTSSTVTSTSGLTACPIISGVPYYKDTNTTITTNTYSSTGTTAVTGKAVNSALTDNVSNPNLLINPDFKINQRGLSGYSGTSAYCVDRWFRNKEATVTVGDSGITLTYSGTSNPAIYQKLPDWNALVGMTLTFSACIGGEIYSCTGEIPAYGTNASYLCYARLDGSSTTPTSSVPHIRIQTIKSTGVIICVLNNVSECTWTKLEVGSTATLFSPPDPATEFAKCQRYYQIRSTNSVSAVDMRPSMGTINSITSVTGGYAYDAEL